MNNSLTTTCTHCSTKFRLLPAQLQAAGGMVRCGVCHEVFDGRQMLEQADDQQQADFLIGDSLEIDLESSAFAERLAQQSEQEQKIFSFSEEHGHNPFTEVKVTEPGFDEEAWAAALLAEEGVELPELQQSQDEHSGDTFSLADDPPLGAIETTAEPEQTPGQEEQQGPAPQQNDLFDIPHEPLQLNWQPATGSTGKRIFWAALLLLGLLGLAGQYIYFNYHQLSQQPAFAALLQRYCPSLGCPLPKLVDVSQLKSSNLMVRRHPEFDDALQIEAVIYNRASFTQAYPLIRLNFLNQEQQIIASRTFNPGEYLGGELAGSQSMPAQIPIRIAFEVLNPSSLTEGYNLEFISPE